METCDPQAQSLSLGRSTDQVLAPPVGMVTGRTLLVQLQFSVIEFGSTHFNPIVIWQDWRGGGKEVSNRERAQLLQRTTAYKQNALLGPLKAFYKLAERTLGALNLADNLVVVLRRRS